MSEEQKNGEPAFPQLYQDYIDREGAFVSGVSGGMSLRDWFAGQSIHAATDSCRAVLGRLDEEAVAERAYRIADAMLAARKEPRS